MKIRTLQIFVLISIALLLSFGIPDHSFAQGWYDIGWKYRKTITIDHTKVPNTDQSSFPMLVNLTADADLIAHARSDGFDILFTANDGTTKIPYQRESYPASSGSLVAWVQVPTVSYTTNTLIYMYYGNSGATDQSNSTGVWTGNNYACVYHLDESTAGTGDYKDATSGGDNGTATEQVIKAVYSLTNSGNSYDYEALTNVTGYTIVSGDVIVYDVYWTSSTDEIAFDFTCTDGNTLRDNGALDQNGINAHPSFNLSGHALNQWYHRVIPIPAVLNGKTIQYYDIACQYDPPSGTATKTGYIDNIFVLRGGGIVKVIYSEGMSGITHAPHISNSGSCTSLGNVTDPTSRSSTGKMINGLNADAARFLSMTTSPTSVTNNWTLEAWVNLAVLSQHGYFLFNGNDADGYGLGIGNGAGDIGSKLIGLYGTVLWVPSNFTFTSVGTWTHVVMERASGTTSFYVNGTSYSASSGGSSAPNTPNAYFTIGNELDASIRANRYFQGLIDEVRISTTARSGDWIATEYNNQNSPSTFYTVETEICHVTATVTAFQNVSCNGGHDGKITIAADGGTSPYYFSTDNGTTWFPSTGSGIAGPHEFTGLGATDGTTIYRARVRDSNGCMSPLIP